MLVHASKNNYFVFQGHPRLVDHPKRRVDAYSVVTNCFSVQTQALKGRGKVSVGKGRRGEGGDEWEGRRGEGREGEERRGEGRRGEERGGEERKKERRKERKKQINKERRNMIKSITHTYKYILVGLGTCV